MPFEIKKLWGVQLIHSAKIKLREHKLGEHETEMLNNIFEPIPYGISINIQQKRH